MLIEFQEHIEFKFSALKKSKLGIAISGGVDSVVLAHLCHFSGIEISLLHCNFQLRGDASNGDQAFVKRLAEQYHIPFITTEFNTKAYVEIHKVSTQVGARELRYRWFKKMAKLYGLELIATAHHLDDNLETFLINLSRGTGLEGLTGIPEINDLYIRPLLPFSKEMILAYAEKNKLSWREDASNSDTKYLRNKLRHNVIPLLKEIQPNLLSNFNTTVTYLQQSNAVVKSYTQNFKNNFLTEDNTTGGFKISVGALKGEQHQQLLLFELLNEYGFSAWEDISELLEAQSGKKILSQTHILLKDRDLLFLYPITAKNNQTIQINSSDREVKITESEKLILKMSSAKEAQKKDQICIDLRKVQFPLTVRKWEEGDYFYPTGMQGKKKVSKYFKDEKFSTISENQLKITYKELSI